MPGDGEHFGNHVFSFFLLGLLCVCLGLYILFVGAHAQLELYFYAGSVDELLFKKIVNYLENQVQVLRRGGKATTIIESLKMAVSGRGPLLELRYTL